MIMSTVSTMTKMEVFVSSETIAAKLSPYIKHLSSTKLSFNDSECGFYWHCNIYLVCARSIGTGSGFGSV